jgi:2-phosphosulfolactate phosphatase
MTFDQSEFDIRCEWGEKGVSILAPISDVIIIVDVISFSSAVEIAVSRGVEVYPYRFRDGSAREYANSIGAFLAGRRGKALYSLSPGSLMYLPENSRIVLPSPNGSTLTLLTGNTTTFTGCLRNCRAVAEAAMKHGKRISVIPAGERWEYDGSLRPAIEDLLGAGAIISFLKGGISPESRIALATFTSHVGSIRRLLRLCCSGKELADMGYASDIDLIAELDVSDSVPVYRGGAYGRPGD